MTRDNEIIEKFLSNKLSEREAEEFYAKLQENPDLEDKLGLEVIRSYNKTKLKEKLQDIDKEMQATRVRRLTFLKVAASVIILVSMGLFLRNYLGKSPQTIITSNNKKNNIPKELKLPDKRISTNQKKTTIAGPVRSQKPVTLGQDNARATNEELISEFYVPYIENQYRSAESPLGIALNYYETEQYDSALLLFEKFLKTVNDADKIDMALFYYAQSYLAKGLKGNDKFALETSKKYFLQFIKDPDYAFYSQSNWYLALVYLKENKQDSARLILNRIIKKQSYKYQEAEKIWEKLP